MITVRHTAVSLSREDKYRVDLYTLRYACGLTPPRYPVPATIGKVVLGGVYLGIVYIDDANVEQSGNWLYAWDTWSQVDVTMLDACDFETP
jgi:hypothetical protein